MEICPLKICGCLQNRNKIIVTIICMPRRIIAWFHIRKSVVWLCLAQGKVIESYMWLCGDGVTSFMLIKYSNILHHWTCLDLVQPRHDSEAYSRWYEYIFVIPNSWGHVSDTQQLVLLSSMEHSNKTKILARWKLPSLLNDQWVIILPPLLKKW